MRGLLIALLTFAGSAVAEEGVHWTYSGEHGPEHWGEQVEKFVKLIGEDARGPQPLNGRRVVH